MSKSCAKIAFFEMAQEEAETKANYPISFRRK